ncbi:MAG: DUF3795 domain-containing protein [Candidatus Edwardsbacteria bacterium]|jgi:hypothetical protein|nr:DUF3795 domain-containing protein [Candidatus Edwardsbacteria bacterium]
MISVCGVDCENECRAFGTECIGCHQLCGKVSWAKYIGADTCPIHACVENKGYRTCGECSLLPCRTILVDTKNPDMSDEQYAEDIRRRIRNLRGLADPHGTD